MPIRFATLLVSSMLSLPIAAWADWQQDGVPLSTAASEQGAPVVVSDGAGGAIVAFWDTRSGGEDIYAQRVNGSGVVQWTVDGVALCTAANYQELPMIISDGAGGAIVTWYDNRSGTNLDIYAQRISGAGAVQWAANGVAICVAADTQREPAIVSDGAGGAIIAWWDYRSGTSADIYVQRINAVGAVQWAANGVALSTAVFDQVTPTLVADGAGGAIVCWYDNRSGTNFDIYAQRINSAGVAQWTANGVAVCTAANSQLEPLIASDGSGGAIMTWRDYRGGSFFDIYARRINAAGVPQWQADGVPICTAANDQVSPRIIADGAGGAIITWNDLRDGYDDVYAQRVSAAGNVMWVGDGTPICTGGNDHYNGLLVPDGAGGAIITWQDGRNNFSYDIYAQRVNAVGIAQWTPEGNAICSAANHQFGPVIAADGAGGGIVVWSDYRSNSNNDIYAQRVEFAYGYWGHPEPTVITVADIKHDQGGKVAVNFKASGRDLPVPATIDFYSVWRATDVSPFATSADAPTHATLASIGRDAPLGTTIMIPASSYYWELVGTQTADRWPSYTFSAPTRADSLAGAPANEYFMVSAHYLYDEHVAFASNVVSGHSVDNLAPAAPLLLTAQRVGNYVHLKWNGVHIRDLKDYSVYRKTSAGVTPVPINFLSSAEDTVLTDTSPPASALYYIVTASDVHANQSAPSNEASVQASTGVGNTPPITALTVLQNQPNPFAGTTDLRVGLPTSADLSIEVYDVAGRRVRAQTLAHQQAGWRSIPFDGRDDAGHALASGVYFYRITASGKTVTNKMVIAR